MRPDAPEPASPAPLDPPESLEDRTVMRLREEGLLHWSGDAARAASRPARWRWTPVAAVAAGVVLFVAGFVAGDVRGGQRTLDVVAALNGADAARTAALVQRTGSNYVAALAALAETDTTESEVGREVARAILWSAATELARLDPDDADLWRLVEALEATIDPITEFEAATAEAGAEGPVTPRTVLWF